MGVDRDGLVRAADRKRARHVSRCVVVAVTSLRGSDGAGAGASEMNCGAGDGAVAGGRKAHREAGIGTGTDGEIRIIHRFVSQSGKRDRLAALAGCRIVRDFSCRVVVVITGAVHLHRAGAGAARHRDVVAGRRTDARRADHEWRTGAATARCHGEG